MRPSLPGTVGTPALAAISRAAALSPIRRMTLPGGPDEDQARSLDGVRKIGVLGEEAVPWMHRIGLGLTRGGEDRVDGEIGL